MPLCSSSSWIPAAHSGLSRRSVSLTTVCFGIIEHRAMMKSGDDRSDSFARRIGIEGKLPLRQPATTTEPLIAPPGLLASA